MKGLSLSAQWNDRGLHINILELKTILLAITAFVLHLQNKVVAIQSDDTTAVSYVNRQGGIVSRFLCHIAMRIWHICIAHNIQLIAMHFTGIDNTWVDSLSRDFSLNHEWSLNSAYLHQIFTEWGTPRIAVFATSTAPEEAGTRFL